MDQANRAGSCFRRAKPTELQSEVAVIRDFEAPRFDRSVLETKREADAILKSAGYRLNWVLPGSALRAAYDDLVVLRFRGRCELEAAFPQASNPGPLGITHVSNGFLLPFGEVECDRVVNAVGPAGEAYPAAERLAVRWDALWHTSLF